MAPGDVLKKVKAINERLAVYERKGLTDSYTYQKIQETIRKAGIDTTSKTGTTRISRSKETLQALAQDSSMLLKIDKMGGLGEERKRVKKSHPDLKTTAQIQEHIKNYGKLEKWADEELQNVYEFARELDEAMDLLEIFQSDTRNMEYDQIWQAIRKYEQARDKWKKEAEKSDLSRAVETPAISLPYQNPYERQ